MNERVLPLVSVVIPVYNVEAYLRQSLDCIVDQSLEGIEIICVNDGSTDSSADILKEYAEKDSRVHIIYQDNSGLSAARNTGIRHASGKYLYFFDSDDLLELDALEYLSQRMERDQLEYLCFNVDPFGDDPESARKVDAHYRQLFSRSLDEGAVYKGLELFTALKQKDQYVATAWSAMVLRSFILENELWFHPGILHEDEPWTFSVLMHAARAGCTNRVLYHYRIRRDSIANSQPIFRNALGLFWGMQDINKIIGAVGGPYGTNELDALLSHVRYIQSTAINKYRKSTEEEKGKRVSLPASERAKFEQLIAVPAELRDEIALLKKQNRTLETKLQAVKRSRSYRIGRALTWLPRKIKALFARTGKAKLLFIKALYKLFPLSRKKIVFDNFIGKGFADHPRYIAEEIHRRGLDWDIVWIVKDMSEPIPDWIRKVKYRSFRSYYETATAKMWVDNVRNAHLLPKKKGQVYLQTWHASSLFIFKFIEKDNEEFLSPTYLAAAKYDGTIIDGILSQDARQTEGYKRAYWLSDRAEILEYGGPREDCLFDRQYVEQTRSSVRRELNLCEDDYVVLYAPTFRDDGDTSPYELDFPAVVEAFEKKLGKRCKVLIRLHPNVPKHATSIQFSASVIDASIIGDTNDAMMACDAVITDFSSLLYEACLLRKTPFRCALDADAYVKMRRVDPVSDSYPFTFAKSMEEFLSQIEKIDFDEYWKTIDRYMAANKTFDDGKASARAVDWLIERSGNKQ